MAEYSTLARPYAVAAYKRAEETNTVQQWADQLAFLKAILNDESIQRAVANPKAKREEFTRSFLGLCQGHLSAEGESFVRLLIRNHRLGLVRYIAEQFSHYRAEDEGLIDVTVTSAYALSREESSRLEATLQRVLNKKPRLDISVDKKLIGGVYIRAGDRVIDASVRGQIERLAKRLWN
jgi:F-type H+-transporting ATPase subunit delta